MIDIICIDVEISLTRYFWSISGAIIGRSMFIVAVTAGSIASTAEKIGSNIVSKMVNSAPC